MASTEFQVRRIATVRASLNGSPCGAEFDFVLRWKELDGDDLNGLRATVLTGLKLLELDGLGGQVSRGYGRVVFDNLALDGAPLRAALDALDPFAGAV